jgi:hypothetical protein
MNPDLIIEFGPRSVLALAGIVTLVGGVWYVDRTWDEKGSAAYRRAQAAAKDGSKVVIPEQELRAAFPFPFAFLAGWVLFALSYLFPTNGSSTLDIGFADLIAVAFSLALGVIASVPMGDAVLNRNASKKQKLSMAFLVSWIGLTIASGYSANSGGVSFVLCGVGAVCIVASMKVLWKFRKMGDSWEQEGQPNPKPVVYNLGGPLFVFGWFLFWVGMAATSDGSAESGLPIYFNLRTALAFFAGCGMVPVVMLIDYAHDEGGKYVGLGTDGAHFGRFLESPIPFLSMWVLFGLSSFFQLDNSFVTTDARRWILLANCVAQGILAGVLIQTALYKGNIASKNRFSVFFVLLFLTLAANIGLSGGIPLYLVLPGALLVIAGQKTVFADRKRGDYWMIHKKVNPNPIVYSVGEPLFMTGWILLALAMSQPML